MNKPVLDLLAGAQACIDMLTEIGQQAQVNAVPASDATADIQAAYAGVYAAVDKAIAAAFNHHGDNAGFRVALGNYLLSVAQGSPPDVNKTTAADALVDSGYRPMPSQGREGEAGRRAELVDRLPVLLHCLTGALAEDDGDNPASYVLASVAMEAARELQELEVSHG